MLRKSFSILLTLLLLAWGVDISAEAAGKPTAVVSTETKEAKPGDEVTFDVSLENNPGIAVICLDILYDETRLEPVSYTGSGLNDWTIGTAAVWVDAANTDYTGTVLTLVYKVKDDAAGGVAEVSVDVEAANFDEQFVEFEVVKSGVTIPNNDASKENPSGNDADAGKAAADNGQSSSSSEGTAPADGQGKTPSGESGSQAEKETGAAENKAAQGQADEPDTTGRGKIMIALCSALIVLIVLVFILKRKK